MILMSLGGGTLLERSRQGFFQALPRHHAETTYLRRSLW